MTMCEVSLVLPCLNEEETIGACIDKAQALFTQRQLRAEIVVSDNGSTDTSVTIARQKGARVVEAPLRGYGNAYLKGIASSRGKWIILADSDDTYDLREAGLFIDKLSQGYDFVIGSRFQGTIMPQAMSWSHRYIGNPVLTGMLNIFFKASISDAHCGFRAITKAAFDRLQLKTGGMEFASEMVIEALRHKLKIAQVPIHYYCRKGASKLQSFPDGWRHLRFMLLYSPNYLFLFPGLVLFIFGGGALAALSTGNVTFAGHTFDVHSMVLASFLAIVGFQIINLGLYAKTYALLSGFETENKSLNAFYRMFNLEKGLLIGGVIFLAGVISGVSVLYQWSKTGFGALDALRAALCALTFMVIGIQTVFSSFFLSLIGIQKGKIPS